LIIAGFSRSLASAPPLALGLGLGGLIPFIGLTALTVFWPQTWYAYWLTTELQYGAVILSFVGALHWGIAVELGRHAQPVVARYIWSVLPALIAWVSLQFPLWSALQLQAAALILCYIVDRRILAEPQAPSWLLSLRLLLTVVAAACLLISSLV
jgi:hypothetical protein